MNVLSHVGPHLSMAGVQWHELLSVNGTYTRIFISLFIPYDRGVDNKKKNSMRIRPNLNRWPFLQPLSIRLYRAPSPWALPPPPCGYSSSFASLSYDFHLFLCVEMQRCAGIFFFLVDVSVCWLHIRWLTSALAGRRRPFAHPCLQPHTVAPSVVVVLFALFRRERSVKKNESFYIFVHFVEKLGNFFECARYWMDVDGWMVVPWLLGPPTVR